MKKHIVVIPGDGIGEEVTSAALAVMKKTTSLYGIELTYEKKLAGGAAIDCFGEPLPKDTLESAKKADAILLGAVGGPKWDYVAPAIRPEKAILGLRKELGLFANLRPVRVPDSLAAHSPLKTEKVKGLDILIVRELNGGIYYGERCESEYVNGVEQAWDTEIYSVPEVERIVRKAFEIARLRRKKVTSVDKANVLASSRLWRRTAERISKEFPDVEFNNLYVDNCAMQLVLAPAQFDVIVTANMFGDILTDESAVLAGSIGVLPSASLGDGTNLFEPIHGTAPDIAGTGKANPIGTILSAAMIFRFSFGMESPASMIEQAVDSVLTDGYRTADINSDGYNLVFTEEMGKLIETRIRGD